MSERLVDELFAAFEAGTPATFRPLGVAATRRAVTHRRRRRLGAAALAVFALLGSLAFWPRGSDPIATGDVTVSVPGLVMRRLPAVKPVDQKTVWLFYNSCGPRQPQVGCEYALARSTDRGRTWHRIPLPAFPADQVPILVAKDARSALIMLGNRLQPAQDYPQVLVIKDAGAVVRWEPNQGQVNAATGNRYTVACPGLVSSCSGPRLVDSTTGQPAAHQPLDEFGPGTSAMTGADGRVWVYDYAHHRFLRSNADVSAWQELPVVPGDGVVVSLALSGDGATAWLLTTEESSGPVNPGVDIFELVDDLWQPRATGPEVRTVSVVCPAGAGVALVGRTDNTVEYLIDGAFVPIPELPTGVGINDRRPDGTVVLGTPDDGGPTATLYIGVGVGADRSWTALHLTVAA